MRHAIISDTTRSYKVVFNPYNSDPDEPGYGYFIEENCPVDGLNLENCIFDTYQQAQDHIITHILGIEKETK